MRKYLYLTAIMIITSLNVYSQFNEDVKDVKPYVWPSNRLGLSASSFSGYGLSYQYHIVDKYVIKFSFFGYGESNNNSQYYSNQNLYTTVGAELQMNLHRTRYTRFHAFVAASHWYDDYSSNNYYDQNGMYNSSTINRTVVGGIGFGFEFLAWGLISFNIETGLQGRFTTQSHWETSPNYSLTTTSHPRYYGFGIGGGVTYAF